MQYSRAEIKDLLVAILEVRYKETKLRNHFGIDIQVYDNVLDLTVKIFDKHLDGWLGWYLYEVDWSKGVKSVLFDNGDTVYEINSIDTFVDMLVIEGFIDAN